MFFGLVNRNDLFLVVASTSLANSMRHHKRTTFAAFYQVRSTHFPVCSSLISSSFGRFILRTNRHRLHLLYAFSIHFIVRRTCTGGPSHSHFIHYTHASAVCQAFFSYFVSLRVSLAIASSSLVGISITFTLESAAEITLLSPRTLLASSSILTPRYQR